MVAQWLWRAAEREVVGLTPGFSSRIPTGEMHYKKKKKKKQNKVPCQSPFRYCSSHSPLCSLECYKSSAALFIFFPVIQFSKDALQLGACKTVELLLY